MIKPMAGAVCLAILAGCTAFDDTRAPRPDWVTAHDDDCAAAPRRVAGCAYLTVSVTLDGRLSETRVHARGSGSR